MTNAEAIETLRANYPDACFEQLRCAVDMAINALTKEAWKEEHPVSPLLQKLATNLQSSKQDADDTISRATAIDAVRRSEALDRAFGYGHAVDALRELPSAQSERQKGEGIDHTEDGYVECPFCHSATNCDGNKDELHFCFSCGADMREGND